MTSKTFIYRLTPLAMAVTFLTACSSQPTVTATVTTPPPAPAASVAVVAKPKATGTLASLEPVSYTHLTLPTKRIV